MKNLKNLINNIKEENIIEIAFDATWIDKEVYNLEVTENIRFTCKRKAGLNLKLSFIFLYNFIIKFNF